MTLADDSYDDWCQAMVDAHHDEIERFVGGSYATAEELASEVVDRAVFAEWRARSYDVPSIGDLLGLIFEEGDSAEIAERFGEE